VSKANTLDFPTDYHSPNKIFVGNASTFWDVYPDRPMSAAEYLAMITDLCCDLDDTDTVKYRFLWDGDSDYIKIGRYQLETDAQFSTRQHRLSSATAVKQRRAELEAEATEIIDQIPQHLRDMIRNKLGGQ
jgi:hypothetical protein